MSYNLNDYLQLWFWRFLFSCSLVCCHSETHNQMVTTFFQTTDYYIKDGSRKTSHFTWLSFLNQWLTPTSFLKNKKDSCVSKTFICEVCPVSGKATDLCCPLFTSFPYFSPVEGIVIWKFRTKTKKDSQ